jgi:hypothetical protein
MIKVVTIYSNPHQEIYIQILTKKYIFKSSPRNIYSNPQFKEGVRGNLGSP